MMAGMDIQEAGRLVEAVRSEIGKRVRGQREMVDGLLTALIAGGHILIEGVPGLAKTLAVKTLASVSRLSFKRIQITPDLLPADLSGTLIWEEGAGRFSVRKGPVFANIVLADEINRAPAKVQSALLEAMAEHQVTIGDETHQLPDPFFVLATQNPLEQEGTYALPEAELDRFLVKLLVRYPSSEEELDIVERSAGGALETVPVTPVLDSSAVAQLSSCAASIHCDRRVMGYLVALVTATRPPAGAERTNGLYRYIRFGASPRASIALLKCARVHALFAGRDFVLPEDVKAAAPAVLRHRLLLSYEAEADLKDADSLIESLLDIVPVP